MTKMSNFQFNHIQIGLTYPQARGLTKELLRVYYENWYFNNGTCEVRIVKYLIAEEKHEDGEPHFHVYLRFDNKLRARETRLFDVFFEATGKLYHPYIDKIRGLRNMIKYCTKEDTQPLSNFDWHPSTDNSTKKEIDWEEIYSIDYPNAQAFLDTVMARYPGYFTGHYIPLRQLAYDKYEKNIEEYRPTYLNFENVPQILKSWVDCNLFSDKERPYSLILIGPSRTGKTEWARSIGRHMYFNNYFNLDLWDEEALYAIFDDMDCDPDIPFEKCFRSWKAFFGAQKEFTVTDKYKRKMKVKWGKPIIWISNNEFNCKTSTLDYIRKNSVRVNVYSKLY